MYWVQMGLVPNTAINNGILYAAGLSNASGQVAPTSIPIKVINLSLGGPGFDSVQCAAVADARAQGITVVAAPLWTCKMKLQAL